MIIQELNAVYCKVEKKYVPQLEPHLSFIEEFYRKTRKGKKPCSRVIPIITRDGITLSGFIPRLKALHNCTVMPATNTVVLNKTPNIPGITLRKDQLQSLQLAISAQRGVIHFPTGTGKTILFFGLISCLPPQSKWLFLCRNSGILKQTAVEFNKTFQSESQLCIAGNKTFGPCTLATPQTFVKIDPKVYSTYFDVVFVDECDEGLGFKTELSKILRNCLAPIRYGFTATLPPIGSEIALALEGYIGPVVAMLTLNEAVTTGILTTPKIYLYKVPFSARIKSLRKYPDVYNLGVVHNEKRNDFIASIIVDRIGAGNTVLVIVTAIEHGYALLKALESKKIIAEFVQGSVETELREQLRIAFNHKQIRCVISTAVWKRGIDIPSLNCLVNAAGGKSETAVLQIIGRALRSAEGKTEAEIIDFFDPSHYYLISHFGERLSLYFDQGWMGATGSF